MVLDTLLFLTQLVGVEVVKVDIPYPLASEQVLIDLVSDTLANTPGIRLCVFSHISSMVSCAYPIFQFIIYSNLYCFEFITLILCCIYLFELICFIVVANYD